MNLKRLAFVLATKRLLKTVLKIFNAPRKCTGTPDASARRLFIESRQPEMALRTAAAGSSAPRQAS